MKHHRLVTCLIGLLCVFLFPASCHHSDTVSTKGLDGNTQLIYTDSVLKKLMDLRGTSQDSILRKVNSDLEKRQSPLDRIACYLIKNSASDFVNSSDSVHKNYDRIDEIIRTNQLQLEDYPAHYLLYFLGKVQLYNSKSELNSSKIMLLRLEQYSQKNNRLFLPTIYDEMARYYYLRNEIKKSINYSNKQFSSVSDKTARDSIKYNYKRTLLINRLFYKNGDKSMIDSMQVVVNMLETIFNRHPPDSYSRQLLLRAQANLEFQKNNHKKAILYLEQVFLNDKKRKQEDSQDAYNIANAYNKMGLYDQAIAYYKEAIQLTTKEGNTYTLQQIYADYADALSFKGNYKEAFKFGALSHKLFQDIYNEKKESEIAKLERDYTIKLKEKEVEALVVENNTKETNLRNRTIIFIIITLFSTLSAFFIYVLFRQRELKRNIEKTRIEQQLFRAQMNPHFVFNAIAGIRGNILNDEKENAVNYLGKFSKLLRKLLENSVSDWTSVEDELEFIKNYMSIQQLRYNDKFGFDIVVDDAIDTTHTLIPAMILQPFIENAIEHGFFNIDYKGLIEIKILQLGANMLEIKVKDNGTGIQPSSKAYSTNLKEKSMAMDIVRNRLQILSYDTKTESRYSIIENEGILITITLACKEKDGDHRK